MQKKKTIKIALSNICSDIIFEKTVTYKLLTKHFDVVIDYKDPDFLIASIFGDPKDALMYKCPRILMIGEMRSPDFTLFDYAVGHDFITILDQNGNNRYFRYPMAFWEWNADLALQIEKPISTNEAKILLKEKTKFCNFIYGHKTIYSKREELFNTINKYKRVDSLGTYLNNTKDNAAVPFSLEKVNIQKDYKFTIAASSVSFPGFVTEKITHAFYAHTIPIYIGDPLIDKTFNRDAFINANDYKNEDELLKVIKEIDENDDLFIKMICKNKFTSDNYFSNLLKEYEMFLVRVFSQNKEEAFRRQYGKDGTKYEKLLAQSSIINTKSKLLRKIIKKFFIKKIDPNDC